ncbi:MAG TPA: hypothetical protein VHJ17_01690 [Thermomonospora sp.]|nr:hypothetical protein [Thermomonospora sp.]
MADTETTVVDEAEDSATPETPDEPEHAPEEPEAEKAEEEPEAPPEKAAPPRRRDPVRAVALVLACAAAVWAAWSGYTWYDRAHDDDLHYAELRDEVRRSGEQAVINLNTLDYRTLAQSLKTWQDSSTSELYQQIVQGRAQFEKNIADARTITKARILESAVSELDEHSGRARIIVAVQITVTPPDGQPATKRLRQIGELTRTSSGWKLSALGEAPVGSSGN